MEMVHLATILAASLTFLFTALLLSMGQHESGLTGPLSTLTAIPTFDH